MDNNKEQALETVRLFSNGIEDSKLINKTFAGLLRYIAIAHSGNEPMYIPEVGELKMKIVGDKVFMSIYPDDSFQKFIIESRKAEDNEDFTASPLYVSLMTEITQSLKAKL